MLPQLPELVASLLQQMCIYLVVAYLLSRTPLFLPLMRVSVRWRHKLACYAIFSVFCIMGIHLGMPVGGARANTPAIGAVLGGLLGGPVVGLAVGITAGIHRYHLGGSFALAAAIDIVVQGLLGGLTHRYLISRGKVKRLFSPALAATVTGIGILIELAIDLALSRPFGEALHTVSLIALPEFVANILGAALFMSILIDRRCLLEEQSSAFSAKALRIAARADGLLRGGFDRQNSTRVARIIYEETGVGAVAITDREKILAFIGIGDDHHLPGTPISSRQTQDAIARNEVFFADGNEVAYQCSISRDCPLGSTLVIPLAGEDRRVIGAEVGCQGEVGVACSMAAGGLAELMGASPQQVCIAAEIAMEHNLGLTCDPVGGQVQIPCIERNGMGALKAINATRMAMLRTSAPLVSLDKVIETMFETGKDLDPKYRETSCGGLATRILAPRASQAAQGAEIHWAA